MTAETSLTISCGLSPGCPYTNQGADGPGKADNAIIQVYIAKRCAGDGEITEVRNELGKDGRAFSVQSMVSERRNSRKGNVYMFFLTTTMKVGKLTFQSSSLQPHSRRPSCSQPFPSPSTSTSNTARKRHCTPSQPSTPSAREPVASSHSPSCAPRQNLGTIPCRGRGRWRSRAGGRFRGIWARDR